MDTEIATARLRLRRMRPGDVDGLHRLVSDWDVVKQTATWPWPPDRAFTATRLAPVPEADGMGGPVLLGDDLVGTMVAIAKHGIAEFGYMFVPEVWGRGYATEMGRALIDHVWARFDWPAIHADVLVDNPASARVLEKLGFAEGPRGLGPSAARGGALPIRTFRLLRPGGDG